MEDPDMLTELEERADIEAEDSRMALLDAFDAEYHLAEIRGTFDELAAMPCTSLLARHTAAISRAEKAAARSR